MNRSRFFDKLHFKKKRNCGLRVAVCDGKIKEELPRGLHPIAEWEGREGRWPDEGLRLNEKVPDRNWTTARKPGEHYGTP